jgi:hypothetical protein
MASPRLPQQRGIESAVSTFGHEAVTRAHLPSSLWEAFLRRADLLKPDVLSEVILLGAGALGFAILVLLLVVVLTKGSAP